MMRSMTMTMTTMMNIILQRPTTTNKDANKESAPVRTYGLDTYFAHSKLVHALIPFASPKECYRLSPAFTP
eukprot:10393444-Heterocapsa_arctica.AAC.1